jgi:hypothetical protein
MSEINDAPEGEAENEDNLSGLLPEQRDFIRALRKQSLKILPNEEQKQTYRKFVNQETDPDRLWDFINQTPMDLLYDQDICYFLQRPLCNLGKYFSDFKKGGDGTDAVDCYVYAATLISSESMDRVHVEMLLYDVLGIDLLDPEKTTLRPRMPIDPDSTLMGLSILMDGACRRDNKEGVDKYSLLWERQFKKLQEEEPDLVDCTIVNIISNDLRLPDKLNVKMVDPLRNFTQDLIRNNKEKKHSDNIAANIEALAFLSERLKHKPHLEIRHARNVQLMMFAAKRSDPEKLSDLAGAYLKGAGNDLNGTYMREVLEALELDDQLPDVAAEMRRITPSSKESITTNHPQIVQDSKVLWEQIYVYTDEIKHEGVVIALVDDLYNHRKSIAQQQEQYAVRAAFLERAQKTCGHAPRLVAWANNKLDQLKLTDTKGLNALAVDPFVKQGCFDRQATRLQLARRLN